MPILDNVRTAFQAARIAAKQQRAANIDAYYAGIRHGKPGAVRFGGVGAGFGRQTWPNRFAAGRGQPERLLNFAPRMEVAFRARPCNGWAGRAKTSRNAGTAGLGVNSGPRCIPSASFNGRINQFLLESYMVASLRRNPRSCPAHGRGACRSDKNHVARVIPLFKNNDNCQKKETYKKAKLYAQTHSLITHKYQNLAPITIATTDKYQQDYHNKHKYSTPYRNYVARNRFALPRPFYLPSVSIVPPHVTSTACSRVHQDGSMGMRTFFHTSARISGLHIVASKASGLLKHSDALSYINLLFRISVSFIPITLRRAFIARKARLASLATGMAFSEPVRHTIFRMVCRGALALPFVLLAAVLLASLERTPISGRIRLLLLSQKEESEIVDKVLQVGGSTQVATSSSVPDRRMISSQVQHRDWLAIMRAVLGEEEAPAGTLLGGQVLPASDPRVQLASSVLAQLESGIPHLFASTSSHSASSPYVLPPKLVHTLKNSTRSGHMAKQHNQLLVIDRPESNAFSFGFYGATEASEPGVIIVFSGAIDEILQSGHKDGYEHTVKAAEINNKQDMGWLKSFFGQKPKQANGNSKKNRAGVISGVQPQQVNALAILLAHELAHLVLSHTIESYASTALLWPQLEKLGYDVLRVLVYPITAFFGPFVQDAINATVKAGYEESSGLLPALRSSCESRKLETEADLTALRLLANAGIDPKSALKFWEERLGRENKGGVEGAYVHNHNEAQGGKTSSFLHTHPADLERVQAIKNELDSWERRQRAVA